MSRPKTNVDLELVQRAQGELQKRPDRQICLRLQAIISSGSHPLWEVASILGITRQTLHRWIKVFREQGVEGLRDRPKGHNPAKLNSDHKAEIAQWLARGKNGRGESVHWTLARAYPGQEVLLVLDQAGWHRSKELLAPKTIHLEYLPAYSPELNPVEKLWRWLRRHVCRNKVFLSLQELAEVLIQAFRAFTSEMISSLCNCPYSYNVN